MTKFDLADTGRKTYLEPVLANEPWGHWNWGDGIDAMTGQTMACAFKEFDVTPSSAFDIDFSYSMISSDSEFERALGAEFSASYNCGQSVSVESTFASAVTYSENSMSIVARCKLVTRMHGGQSASPELTDKAQALLIKDASEFRSIYGDYYVDNAMFGGEMAVVYTCHTSSSSSLLELKSKLSGGTSLMTADGASAFSTAAKSLNTTVTVKAFVSGTSDPPQSVQTPEQVPGLLQWFLDFDGETPKHINVKPLRARLVSYRQLAPQKVPDTLPVDPLTFTRMQSLRAKIFALVALTSELPVYYRNLVWKDQTTYGEGVNELFKRYQVLSPAFATEPGLLGPLETDADSLHRPLKQAAAVVAFYNSAIAEQQDEVLNACSAVTGFTRTQGCVVPVKSYATQQDGDIAFPESVPGASHTDMIVGWAIQHSAPHPATLQYDELVGFQLDRPAVGTSIAGFHLKTATHCPPPRFALFWTSKSNFPWL